MDGTAGKLEAKLLYRRLDRLFGALEARPPTAELVETFFEEFFPTLREPLRLRAGVLYARTARRLRLVKKSASWTPPRRRPALRSDARSRWPSIGVYLFTDLNDEARRAATGSCRAGPLRRDLGGPAPARHAFFFQLDEGWAAEELDFALNTVRAALGSRLMEERVRGSLAEAAEIQQSLLLDEPPDFPASRSPAARVPAEEVGGDFFDFIPFDDEMMGLAIGDASGHGLPAALLVRDVVTGLRMGIEKELKIVPVFEKLNHVIHRSNLSSRFVSVFYGELETNGNLIYVNAGHQPPLLFLRIAWSAPTGGTVIGPLPEATFNAASCPSTGRHAGAADGRHHRAPQHGRRVLRRRAPAESPAGQPAPRRRGAARPGLRRRFAFGGGGPWEDDATLVIIRRKA